MPTVPFLAARGLLNTIFPVSAVTAGIFTDPLHDATIDAPVMRNKLVPVGPAARPSTRLSRYAIDLLRELVLKHFGLSP